MPTDFNLEKATISRIRPMFEYLSKQQENQRFTRSIEIAATFILISFFMIFAIRPTALTISALVGDIKSKEIQSHNMKSKISNIIQAQDLFSQVQERYQIVESSFPDKPRYAHITTQFQQTALNQQFELDRLSFNLSGKEGEDVFSISVNSPANFRQAVSFVDELLKNRRLIEINNYYLVTSRNEERGSESSPSGKITLSFTANNFFNKGTINGKK